MGVRFPHVCLTAKLLSRKGEQKSIMGVRCNMMPFRDCLRRKVLFVHDYAENIIVQEWKNGDVRIVGEFGKDLGKSDRTFEATCEKYLGMGYTEYVRKGAN